MNDIKSKISSREKEWDFYKKYTNPYEYIHTVVPQKKKSVSKYKPISRSYFKMLEIIAEFNLDHPGKSDTWSGLGTWNLSSARQDRFSYSVQEDNRNNILQEFSRYKYISENSFNTRTSSVPTTTQAVEIDTRLSSQVNKMRTFHLAEGPGGFIEAICNKRNNPNDEYYGMTIILDENDDNVPAWNKTGHYLSQHPNINIEYGIDGTGNLLHIDNFEYCVKKYGSSMDLVTADGGFDFSKDFNGQEISITNLLWGQVCYALCLQKHGGNFVLKIFDVFYEHTVDILYILSSFYKEVNVCKLKTSRVGNSEKYVVCKHFMFESSSLFYPKIHESFLQIKSESLFGLPVKQMHGGDLDWDSIRENDNHSYIWRLLSIEIPRHFTKNIEEINAIFGQQQIENIHYTLSLIDKQPKQEKLDQFVKQNISKCINWCIEHSVIYNNLVTVNLFGQFFNSPTFVQTSPI